MHLSFPLISHDTKQSFEINSTPQEQKDKWYGIIDSRDFISGCIEHKTQVSQEVTGDRDVSIIEDDDDNEIKRTVSGRLNVLGELGDLDFEA